MPGRTQPTRLFLPQSIRGAQAQGKASGSQQEMVIVDPRWVGVPGAPGSYPPPTGEPDQNYAVTKIGNAAGYTLAGPPTLTSGLTAGATITSLLVTSLGAALYQGQVVVLVSGGSGGLVQGFTVDTGGAAAGAATIPVVSQQAAHNFPVGTIVSGAASSVPGFGITMWRQAQVLTSQLTQGTSYTSLACTSFLPGTGGTAPAGTPITTIQPGALPVASQAWTLYSAAAAGATTLQVTAGTPATPQTAQAAQATFPVGSLIGLWLPL